MSLLLLIDGYNVVHPVAPSRNPDPAWLQRQRESLLRQLATHLSEEVRLGTCVVFDASNPPRDRPHRDTVHGMEVRFAVGYNSADELLVELIRDHHVPKRLLVVSSDHQIQLAAKRRGARFQDSEPWMDDLTDGRVRLAIPLPQLGETTLPEGAATDRAGQGGTKKPRVESAEEVDRWLREFGFDD